LSQQTTLIMTIIHIVYLFKIKKARCSKTKL
jgi:hypothetical protein